MPAADDSACTHLSQLSDGPPSCSLKLPSAGVAISHDKRIGNFTLVFFMQVSGSNVVPMSLQTQNLISDTLLTLLSSDHVFLMKLTEVDETQPVNGVGSATMTYVMQKASATTDVTTVLAALSVVQTATSHDFPLVCSACLMQCMFIPHQSFANNS